MDEVIDQTNLDDYHKKRKKWISWYETGEGEPNSLQDQCFAMLLLEMSFRVVWEELEKDPASALNTPLVAYLLSSGYFSSQVLATRRLLDKSSKVISLRRLIEDIRNNRDLVTREIYVSFDGTAYEPELPELTIPGLQLRDSPFSKWNRSRVRHERFDKLSKVAPENRKRDNKIHESVFSRMDEWINASGASELVILSHKYLAHAAQKSSITTALPRELSFAKVEGIHKAIVQSMRVIYDIILSSSTYSEVVPGVPPGFFGKVWNGERLIESTARMNKQWDEMAKERNQWVRNLDDVFFM